MARRERDSGAPLPRVYEGEAVLAELLAVAGSPLPVATVKDVFAQAHAAHDPPSEAIPALFPEEPHFPSPELARRLYGNLFGLWDRVARGQLDEPRRAPEPP